MICTGRVLYRIHSKPIQSHAVMFTVNIMLQNTYYMKLKIETSLDFNYVKPCLDLLKFVLLI